MYPSQVPWSRIHYPFSVKIAKGPLININQRNCNTNSICLGNHISTSLSPVAAVGTVQANRPCIGRGDQLAQVVEPATTSQMGLRLGLGLACACLVRGQGVDADAMASDMFWRLVQPSFREIEQPAGQPQSALMVVGCGLTRSGTMSLADALEEIGTFKEL